jgi:Signal peptidase, peptidase S26
MFTPKYLEEGRALAKVAQKVINYRKDVARSEDLERLQEKLDGLKAALKARSNEKVRMAEKPLLAILGKVQPLRDHQGIRENVELFVVAIVLALGIRAYYLQPFKIPTGSMQPTLNGVIAHRMEGPPPNFFVRAFQFLALGRSYEDVICDQPGDSIVSISPIKVKQFWDGSLVQMASGKYYRVGIDPRSLQEQMHVFPGQISSRANRSFVGMPILEINSLWTNAVITFPARIVATFLCFEPTGSVVFHPGRTIRASTISSDSPVCRTTPFASSSRNFSLTVQRQKIILFNV